MPTLAGFNGQAQDLLGNVITAFQVEVRYETAGAPLATIYSDRTGLTPLANPFTPSSSDNGHFRFHAAGGAFKVRAFNASTGFEKVWRYVAIGLAGESDDVVQFPGFLMTFDSTTTEGTIDNGDIRANNANLASATQLYINTSDDDGVSIQTRLLELANQDTIILVQSNTQASYTVVSVVIGSPATYAIVTVTAHSGATSLTAGATTSLQLLLSGTAGTDGAPGAPRGIAYDLSG